MDTSERARVAPPEPATTGRRPRQGARSARALAWFGGGTNGNEQLTVAAGVVLLVLLPVLGVTILAIGQLIWLHLFVGFLLLGPVTLKMASTGYRFTRYYTGDPIYGHKGPPELVLRLIAPVVVLTTVIVFASGILLLAEGPSHRGLLLLAHKASFIIWLGATGLHVLGHLPRLAKSLRVARVNVDHDGLSPGSAGRGLALVGALVAGLVLAIVLIPDFAAWTAHGVFLNHHDG